MQNKLKLEYNLGLIIVFWGTVSFGHDIAVPMAITQNASASALANSAAFSSFLNTISSDFSISRSTMAGMSAKSRKGIGGTDSLLHADPIELSAGKNDRIGCNISGGGGDDIGKDDGIEASH
jgi:hypothetical protein